MGWDVSSNVVSINTKATQIAQVSKLCRDASNEVVVGDIKFDSKIREEAKLTWNGEHERVVRHIYLLKVDQQPKFSVNSSRKGIISECELLEVCQRLYLSWELTGEPV